VPPTSLANLAKSAGNGQALAIADCRLSIEEVVWQLLAMSISNRQSKTANSRHPRRGDNGGNSSQETKKFGTSATEFVSKTPNETDTGEAINPDEGRWFSSLEAAHGTKTIAGDP
jgi:hypothetical protein